MAGLANTLAPSSRSLEVQRDALLDQVSYLQDARNRATDYLGRLGSEGVTVTSFEIGEALSILWESLEESAARRFPGVLDSEPATTKEEQ